MRKKDNVASSDKRVSPFFCSMSSLVNPFQVNLLSSTCKTHIILYFVTNVFGEPQRREKHMRQSHIFEAHHVDRGGVPGWRGLQDVDRAQNAQATGTIIGTPIMEKGMITAVICEPKETLNSLFPHRHGNCTASEPPRESRCRQLSRSRNTLDMTTFETVISN